MSNHRQGCKWHGHELRHEVSSSVCGCDDQLMQHKPECPASWGVGDMPEGLCTFCEMLRACEQRVREEDQRSLIKYGVQMFKEGKEYGRPMAYAAGLDAAREAIKNTRCPEGYEVKGCSHWDDALAAIDALREEQK